MTRIHWTMLAAALLLDASQAAEKTMQAAVRAQDGRLVVQSVSVPEPAAGEVRIRVSAAGVNPSDWNIALLTGGIPGFEVSGVIDAIGESVRGWNVGDEVIASSSGRRGYAQYANMPVTRLARKPKNIDFIEAAGIPVAGETAYRALIDDAQLKAGQRVLVHGAAGGVGSAAVQIAHAHGAHVIGTASPRNHEFLRDLGADQVIDYNAVRFEDVVKDIDVVLNGVDAETGERSLGVVKPGGILISLAQPPSADNCARAKIKCIRVIPDNVPTAAELLAKVVELVEAGKYRVNVDRQFTLAEANEAWDLGRQRHTRGKLIIVPR